MNTGRRAAGTVLFLILAAIAGYAYPLLSWDQTARYDWRYFNSLSLVVASNVLHYGRLPLHDPWACGGLDIAANPQSRIFSPLGLLDIALAPHLANLVGLVLYAIAGIFGMYLLLRHLRVSRASAAVGAAIFINSSWFGLHFAEGHIPYGAFQLLPFVLLMLLRLAEPPMMVGLAALLGFFILDGGIYPFIFSLLLAAAVLAFNRDLAREVWKQARLRPWVPLGATAGLLLLAAPKLVPSLLEHAGRNPSGDWKSVPPLALFSVFFEPFQTMAWRPSWGRYRFHEYGCYLGFAATALLGAALVRREFRAENRRWLWMMALWFWIATLWLPGINPWRIFQNIPVLNNAHVPSRVFILMYLVFVILAVRALDRIRTRRFLFGALALVAVVEALFVKNFPFYSAYTTQPDPRVFPSLIDSTTIRKTIPNGEKPDLYLARDLASSNCYEPAAPSARVLHVEDPAYRGEIVLTDSGGTFRSATLSSFTPGRISFSYDSPVETTAHLNTHALQGWRLTAGQGEVRPSPDGMLKVALPAGRREVVLEYRPGYLIPSVLAGLLGILLFTVLMGILLRRPGRPSNER